MSDDEEYELEYETDDGDQEDDPEIELENLFHLSSSQVEDEPQEALEGFERIVKQQKEKGLWGFKALKQLVQLKFQLKKNREMLDDYREMLTYIKSAVTRNDSERAIQELLDVVSGQCEDMTLLQELYEMTLEVLKEINNDRLWFKTNLKLGKLWLQKNEFTKLQKVMKELHKSCEVEDGSEDLAKGTQLLEVYALEIQMYTEMKNNKKLKELYEKSLRIQSAIPHPKIMGIIRECGGKMHMSQREWESSMKDFFEAFKSYDDASDIRKIHCLKYLILSNMLALSKTDPFAAQETMPYKSDPEIVALTNLVAAYQDKDINTFERILKLNRKTIMDDPFLRQYIDDLLRNIRTAVLIMLIRPYTQIQIPFISKALNIPKEAVEDLLVSLILDKQIQGHIDQVNERLVLTSRTDTKAARYEAMDRWSRSLATVSRTVGNKVQ